MQLGPFKIDHPFILAPMAGITNSPFRRLMRQMKSAIVISELVSANGLEFASKKTQRLLDFKEDERILGLQIFGEHEDLLVKGCQHIEKLGADFVDLNLGCPVPKVVKRGAGSAMCRDPIRLGKILKNMVDSVQIPVTIKIRTGWDADSINAHDVVKAATDAGVSWVAIHGRTRAQGYSGEANWEYIGEVKARASIPIIGNGDLNTAELAVKRHRDYGVDAVMIGRGALRNPFIFEQAEKLQKGLKIADPEPTDYLKLMEKQTQFLDESFDEKMSLLQMRKFFSWYSAGYPGCHEFRKKVFTLPTRDALLSEARNFFISTPGRNREFLRQPFLMGGHG